MTSIFDQVLKRDIPDAQVIFNPGSGNAAESDTQLAQVLTTLRDLGLKSKVFRIQPNSRIHHVSAHAAKRGTPFVVACGGDNTIDLAARGMVGTPSTLVVVPTGTRNNIAHALKLPLGVPEAVGLVKAGQRTQVDAGRVHISGRQTFFLELLTVGLSAAMFPSMDQAQKGNLASIGDLLSTFITQPPATFHLNFDRGAQVITTQALMLVVMNMPYVGANFQLDSSVDYCDGLLDVFVYADLGKLDLITYALQVAQGSPDDPRVRHLRVKEIEIQTDPPMPIMLDGNVLKESALRGRALKLEAAPRLLNIMVPSKANP